MSENIKYTFRPHEAGTHVRDADGVRGNLREHDLAKVRLEGDFTLLDSAEGFSVHTEPEPEPEPTPVPPIVTRRQFLLAALAVGVTREDIRLAIMEIQDNLQREAALIEFEEATQFERAAPLLAQIAVSFEVDADALDQLFITAAQL